MTGTAPAAAGLRTRRWAPLLALETATILAGVANGITQIAFPWVVLQITGSVAAAGTIAAATAVPMVIASLFSGTVVDRIGRRLTSIGSDLLSLLSVALVPIAAAVDRLDVLVLTVVAVLGAVFDPAGITARESMLPGAAQAARVPLERLNGIHEAVWNLSFIIGPALGGVLVATVGSIPTFWATAVCFALSALVIALVRIPGDAASGEPSAGVLADTRDGIRFVGRDRLLRTLTGYYMVLVAAYMPIQAIVLPAYFEAQDRPQALGAVLLVMSAGAIVGSLAYAALGTRLRPSRVMVPAAVLASLPIIAFGTLPELPAMLVLGAASGFFWGPINPLVNLAIQRRTPSAMLGRVNGLIGGLAFALAPLGYLLAGLVYAAVGPGPTLYGLGGGLLLAALVLIASPAVGELDHLPPPQPEGHSA
jgi:MFS family permease